MKKFFVESTIEDTMSLKSAAWFYTYLYGWKENEEQIWRFANEAKYTTERESGARWVNEWMTRANIKEIIRVELLPLLHD